MRRALAAAATGAAGLALLLCMAAPAVFTLALRDSPGGAGVRSGQPAAAGSTAIATEGRSAAAPTQAAVALPHGSIVLVRDTLHFWVADERGVLHWAAGTRALVGRYARWDQQRTVSAAELERLPRGEPWLLSPIGFVRGETDDLHVVVWQSGVAWPALMRVSGAAALTPFGITPEHVGRLSTDTRTWERLHDVTVETLSATLTPLSGTPLWTAGQWSGVGAQVSPADTYDVRLSFHEPKVDPEVGVQIGAASYPTFPCSGFLGLISSSVVDGEEELLLAERLTTGVENCTIQGRVTLTRRTDRRLFYTWALPDRRMAVSGILLRD